MLFREFLAVILVMVGLAIFTQALVFVAPTPELTEKVNALTSGYRRVHSVACCFLWVLAVAAVAFAYWWVGGKDLPLRLLVIAMLVRIILHLDRLVRPRVWWIILFQLAAITACCLIVVHALGFHTLAAFGYTIPLP